MTHDTSIRNTDAKVIALLVVILAALIAAIGFALHDPSLDMSHLHPIRSAQAKLLSDAPQAVAVEPKPAVDPATAKAPTDETWAADESSHGMRPDAAH